MNFELRNELFRRADADRAMRTKVIENGDYSLWDTNLDKDNTSWLRGIIEQKGWPTITEIGPDGSQAAWLLVQHADHDLDFQVQCLELMKALPDNEVKRANIAYLEDRVRLARGESQLYGTQFKTESGIFGPQPIEDIKNLAARRKAMDLEPFEDNQERLRRQYKNFS